MGIIAELISLAEDINVGAMYKHKKPIYTAWYVELEMYGVKYPTASEPE